MKNLKKITKVAMATVILASSFVSVTKVSAEDRESKAKGRVEFYQYNKKNTGETYPYDSEAESYGAECVVNINVKKPNKHGFYQDYKYSVKAKGVKKLGIGDDFCKAVQKHSNVNVGYNKYDGLMGRTNTGGVQLRHQGEKIAVKSFIRNKKIVNKYYKAGVIGNKTGEVNVMFTYVVKNQKSLPKGIIYGKNFKKKYVRTPSISKKNVVINNVHPVDGQDKITVKNIKKGTRLNFHSGEGVLYKSVKVNKKSYTLTLPKNKDITKALFTGTNKAKKSNNVIISRTEPNSHESYRMKYKIPTQKAQQHTKLNIYDLHSDYEYNIGSIVFEGDTVYVSQQSEVGKNSATYRVKYNGKTVFTFANNVSELVYDDEYFFNREYTKGTKEYDFFKTLVPLSTKEKKKYTLTVQVKGKKESYPMQYLYPKLGTPDYQSIEVFD